MTKHNESTLPLWAQRELELLRRDLADTMRQLEHAAKANCVLQTKGWFTIHGPKLARDPDVYHLWLLDCDRPMAVCSLGRGDVLLVGRAPKDDQHE